MKTIKKEMIYCPICDKEHEVELRENITTALIKGERINYNELYYYCDKENEEYENCNLLDINLQTARNEYRKEKGLLTSLEIKEIREEYNLTQTEFAFVLGMGEKTIARYETKQIQEETANRLMVLFKEDLNYAFDCIKKAKDKINESKYKEIYENAKRKVQIVANYRLIETELNNKYLDFNEPSDLNGYTILNVDKIKSMAAYFAEHCKDVYNVKLMKLFWYSDALSKEINGRGMSGLVYQHRNYGALPIGYELLSKLDSINCVEAIKYDNICTKIIPKESDSFDSKYFSNDEIKIMQIVCDKFKNTSSRGISEIMHKEDIYLKTQENDLMPFSLVEKLKAFKGEYNGHIKLG